MRDRICSYERFKSITRELPAQARDILTIAYYTGIRIAEITGLDLSRVDLKNGLISLGKKTRRSEISA